MVAAHRLVQERSPVDEVPYLAAAHRAWHRTPQHRSISTRCTSNLTPSDGPSYRRRVRPTAPEVDVVVGLEVHSRRLSIFSHHR